MNAKESICVQYETPYILNIELNSEGILCSSDNGNEMLEENDGIW